MPRSGAAIPFERACRRVFALAQLGFLHHIEHCIRDGAGSTYPNMPPGTLGKEASGGLVWMRPAGDSRIPGQRIYFALDDLYQLIP